MINMNKKEAVSKKEPPEKKELKKTKTEPPKAVNAKSVFAAIADFFRNLNDKQILAFWLAGLFIISFFLWFLTAKPRINAEIKAINTVLEKEQAPCRIKEEISPWLHKGNAVQAGNWYLLSDNRKALVWSIPSGGMMIPCLVVFNKEQKIDKIYPLSLAAKLLLEKKSYDIVDLYQNRLENAAEQISKRIN